MITSVLKLNEFIDKCEKKLALTLAEKQIYRFYNLHKWLVKQGYVINLKNYNFSKNLAKISLIKANIKLKVVKKCQYFLNYNAYLSYCSKNFFVLVNQKLMKIYYKSKFISTLNCDGQLRTFVKFGALKVYGKNLVLAMNSLNEKLIKLNCLYERTTSTDKIIYSIKNNKAITLFDNEKFYELTKSSAPILNRLLCNNPYYNNYPYGLKSQILKKPALYNFNLQEKDVASLLPPELSVFCPDKFNSRAHVEVGNSILHASHSCSEDKFSKCYHGRNISFFIFKKKALLKLNLNGEKCLIKKSQCGLKFIFDFGVMYFSCNSKILNYGIIDGCFVAQLESNGASISCNLGLHENKSSFFENFAFSVRLKKLCPVADEFLCANPFKTLKLCASSFFINTRKVIIEERDLDDAELQNLLRMAQEQIKSRINLEHVNKHLLALLPFVNQKNKLSLLNLSQLVSTLPSMRSLVQLYQAGKSLTLSQNELILGDAIELAEMVDVFRDNRQEKGIDYCILKV